MLTLHFHYCEILHGIHSTMCTVNISLKTIALQNRDLVAHCLNDINEYLTVSITRLYYSLHQYSMYMFYHFKCDPNNIPNADSNWFRDDGYLKHLSVKDALIHFLTKVKKIRVLAQDRRLIKQTFITLYEMRKKVDYHEFRNEIFSPEIESFLIILNKIIDKYDGYMEENSNDAK